MELMTKYQYTYFIHPYIIDENKYKLQNDIEKELIEIYYPDRNQISLIPEMNLSNEELINNVYKFKNREIGYRLSSK